MQRSIPAALEAFLTTSLDVHLSALEGSDPAERATQLFREVARRVPAYRALLAQAGVDPAEVRTADDFRRLPVVDKDGYLRAHPLPELCWDGTLSGSDTVAVSSGSTGVPFYFPRGLRHELSVAWRFEQVFRDAFHAQLRSTLAVVCFPLGTWVGGMYTAACCRLLAAKGYPLLVVTPGNQPAEILRVVQDLGPHHDQVVLLGYPPFLKDVIDAGRAQGVEWARYRVKLVMAGEVVSEAWREIVHQRSGGETLLLGSASLYGTADAGVLGVETPLAIAIRRMAAADPAAAEALFGERRLPTLVQYDPEQRFFEEVHGRLVFTGDGGGIPLVRYAIGDHGGVTSFEDMMDKVRALGGDAAEECRRSGAPVRALPFVHVFGRRHHAVSFYGANVFVEMVRLGLERPDVRDRVSGKFVMEVVENGAGDRALLVEVELARGVAPEGVDATGVARAIEEEVALASGEFRSYVPASRRTPTVRLWPHAHPAHFPTGVKHRYVRDG